MESLSALQFETAKWGVSSCAIAKLETTNKFK